MKKYRGKRVDNGEWAYGYYVANKLEDHADILVDFFDTTDDGLPYCHQEFFKVIPSTVGQCTGMKDKKRTCRYPKGQEIYYDDRVEHADSQSTRIGVVKYDEEMCCLCIVFENSRVFGGKVLFESVKVINSIYDTPSLLCKEK